MEIDSVWRVIMNRMLFYIVTFLGVANLFVGNSFTYAEEKSLSAKACLEGDSKTCPIPNFAKVSKNLFRGGRLNQKGIQVLKEIGVKTIINLDNIIPGKRSLQEGKSLGMEVYQIPLSPILLSNKDYKKMKDIINLLKNTKHKIYIHCLRGKERTGLMVALHRIMNEGWTLEDAKEEMLEYGFSKVRVPIIYYIQRPFSMAQPTDKRI